MTDRELLELAAKAAGIKTATSTCVHRSRFSMLCIDGNYWNPLTDDGDALRLAVKLQLEIGFPNKETVWSFGRKGEVSKEDTQSDHYSATRRAIVRAAAEIGKLKE